MSDREQIDTLISAGRDLPPINPYLDDVASTDEGETGRQTKSAKTKKKNKTPAPAPKVKSTQTSPDPKEYIAELERPEGEALF